MSSSTEENTYRNRSGSWFGTLYEGKSEKPDGKSLESYTIPAFKRNMVMNTGFSNFNKVSNDKITDTLKKQNPKSGVRFENRNGRIIPVVDVIVDNYEGPKITGVTYDRSDTKTIPGDATVMFGLELDIKNPFILPNSNWTFEIYKSGNDLRVKAKMTNFKPMFVNRGMPAEVQKRNMIANMQCKGACAKMGYDIFAEEVEEIMSINSHNVTIMNPNQRSGTQNYAASVHGPDGSIHQFSGNGSHVKIKGDQYVVNAKQIDINADEKTSKGLMSSGSAENNMDKIYPQSNLFFPYPRWLPPITRIVNLAATIKALYKVIDKAAKFVAPDEDVDAFKDDLGEAVNDTF